MNVPQRRFKGFSDEWITRDLENCLTQNRLGGNYDNSEANEGLPVIKMGNVARGKIVLDKVQYLPLNSPYDKDDVLKEGDILFNTRNTLDLVGKVAIWRNELPIALYNSNLMRLSFNNNFEKTNKFVNALFNTQVTIKKLRSYATGTTSVAAIYTKDLLNLSISYPSLEEQKKVARFFSVIDKKLDSLKKKKGLLEQYKKGVMQKIFSQELRFKDEKGKDFPQWEVKKLGEVGITYGGLSGKTADDFGEGKPYIQYKQIFDNSKIDLERCGYASIGPNERQNKVKFGDILLTVSSETPREIGYSSAMLDDVDELYLNSFCFGFRPNSLEELFPGFLRYLFRSIHFRKNIYKLAQGSTRYNMSKSEFLKLPIPVPQLIEQEKIAEFLTAIDDKIALVEQQINQTELWKKGLLQQMFVQ